MQINTSKHTLYKQSSYTFSVIIKLYYAILNYPIRNIVLINITKCDLH